MIPPGSLPDDLGTRWSELLQRVRDQPNHSSRFDVIKFGLDEVAPPLRSLAALTGGSVRRVESVHEMGTSAQQVRTYSSPGFLVSVPQRVDIDLKAARELVIPKPGAGGPAPAKAGQPPPEAKDKSRSTLPISSVPGDPRALEIEFASFQAEEGGEYEFVFGLSRPLSSLPAIKEALEKAPQLLLYRDGKLTEQPYLELDRRVSSPWLLVFRLPMMRDGDPSGLSGAPLRLTQGVYTPKLRIRGDAMPKMRESSPVDPADSLFKMTFSIATARDSIQIVAGIREPATFASADRLGSQGDHPGSRGLRGRSGCRLRDPRAGAADRPQDWYREHVHHLVSR